MVPVSAGEFEVLEGTPTTSQATFAGPHYDKASLRRSPWGLVR